ncbi:MAG: hypothetical protein AB7F31_00110 [Parachlamydiales bacterium]
MHWPRWINFCVAVVAALGALFALYGWWPERGVEGHLEKRGGKGVSEAVPPPPVLGTGCFALNRVMPKPQLPDLQGEIAYLGPNGRPDAKDAGLYLVAKGESEPVAGAIGQPLFMTLKGEGFTFTQEPTHLWMTPRSVNGNALEVEVGIETPEGEKRKASVALTEQEGRRQSVWQMGELRVDGSLLARQRARWFGEDRFLAEHGGEEYGHAGGRERIDFGEGTTGYSCFVGLGEGLVWNGERWVSAKVGDESRPHPLLLLTRREERSLHLELWDEAGRMKTPITLMRSKDGWLPNQVKESLRFVAAKTWSQFVLEWGQERLQVRPGDWLLLEKEGVRLLGSAAEIVEYAEGRLTGELLVIEGLIRNEGKHLLQSHLFNMSRSERIPFEIPLTLELRPGAYAAPVGVRKVPHAMEGSP